MSPTELSEFYNHFFLFLQSDNIREEKNESRLTK